jgi:protein involved in ribonucleotide reduction
VILQEEINTKKVIAADITVWSERFCSSSDIISSDKKLQLPYS